MKHYMPRDKALHYYKRFHALIKRELRKSLICGSYRRGCAMVGDIDVVVIGSAWRVKNIAKQHGYRILASGDRILRVEKHNLQIDMLFTNRPYWHAAVMHATGPKKLNIRQRIIAQNQGWTLSQRSEHILNYTEREIYKKLREKFLTPRQRQKYA